MGKLYRDGLANVNEIISNPAYSATSGTIGLWLEGEPPTVPGDRRLDPATGITVDRTKEFEKKPDDPRNKPIDLPLGVALARRNGQVLSLDISNTFPFYPEDPDAPIPTAAKYDVGSFSLLACSKGAETEVAQITYDNYDQSAFDKRSGLIDIPITAEQAQAFDNSDVLVLQSQKQGNAVVSQEVDFVVEVLESGTFIDSGGQWDIRVQMLRQGKTAAGVDVWVAQYGNPYMATTSDYYIGFEDPDNKVDFVLYNTNKETNASEVNEVKFIETPSSNRSGKSSLAPTVTAMVSRAGTASQPQSRQADKAEYPVEVTYKEVMASPVGVSLDAAVKFGPQNGVTVQKVCKNLDNVEKTPIVFELAKATTDENGIAQFTVEGVRSGFPTLRFATNPDEFNFITSINQTYIDFLAPIRVLRNDTDLLQEFINEWNKIYQSENASEIIWEEFIYPKTLQVFYYLYPIMNKYMPLNILSRVEGAIDQLILLISPEYRAESTLAMPITRDMPGSSRMVLEFWANELVKKNYPPMPLTMPKNDA